MSSSDQQEEGSIQSIAEEYVVLQKTLPRIEIKAKTKSFISGSYQRPSNRYTHIKVTLTILESYPEDKPVIDVEVPVKGLKRRLETDMNEQCELMLGNYGQVVAVFRALQHFVDNNRFVSCWKELKQCRDLVLQANTNSNLSDKNSKTKSKQSIISFNESSGKVRLTLHHKNYFYSCAIVVDEGYPSTVRFEDWGKACRLKMLETNLPPKIESILTAQAQDLVRKMQDGIQSDEAIRQSNPIKEPTDYVRKEAGKDIEVRLTQNTLKGLKKDVETLKVVSNLRTIDSESVAWNAKVKAHAAKERKDARRNIKKLTQDEIETDLRQEEKEKQWQIDEKIRLSGYDISKFDGSNPQPSLRTLVDFLLGRVWNLPEERCPVCNKFALPNDPKALLLVYQKHTSDCASDAEKKKRKEAKKSRPIRSFCGCWYHYNCLNKFMTEPPFGASCKKCKDRVYHPEWPDSIQALERAWAAKQARKREMDDVAMAFL